MNHQTGLQEAHSFGMIDTMAKNFKWVERPNRGDRETLTGTSRGHTYVWLTEGELANLVVIEKTGRGTRWERAPTRLRVIATVIILKVWDRSPKGYCDVLRDGKPTRVANQELRPMKE